MGNNKFRANNVSDLEKHYTYKQIGPPKFLINTAKYNIDLHFIIPYIYFFINKSQPDREYFFEHVPYQAIKDTYELILSEKNKIDNWINDTNETMSDNYIALGLLTMLIEEYVISRNDSAKINEDELKRNLDDLSSFDWKR